MPASPAPQIRNFPLGGRLLSDGVARPLPGNIDWSDGVSFLPSCGGAKGAWGCANSFDPTPKEISDSPDAVTFKTFLAYHQSECKGANQVEAATAAAQTAYARVQSEIWATELHTSEVGNDDLVSTANDLTPGGGPADLKASLTGLVSSELECGVVDILLHAPYHALPSFLTNDLVEWVAGRYLMGNVPISFDLYPNTGPTGNPHDPPTAEQAWIYATGPVEWAATEQKVFVDRTERQNRNTITVEQHGILRFDPCCVNAVLAQIC